MTIAKGGMKGGVPLFFGARAARSKSRATPTVGPARCTLDALLTRRSPPYAALRDVVARVRSQLA